MGDRKMKSTINVTVKLFATLREGRFDIRSMELADGATVADVVSLLGIAEEEVALIMADHRHREMDYALADRMTLALFPPVGGG
ncbi:MAG: ThiS family protein [Spirochaetes bacterium ADurb.BinA120]|jgi:molybdopterin converting factor small subunit|nr:MAG: ThiS family protein [Spirochaetes bacterium ADurb.BinA120]